MNKIYEMKQKILLSLFIVISILFMGCKKGENDPFLSLKSRTARLCQKWKLSDGTITTTTTYNGVEQEEHHYTFDGKVKIDEYSINNQSYMVSVYYSQDMEFGKNGTYNTTVIDNDSLYTIEGNWMWSQKKENLKKKEAVILFPTKETNLNYNYTYSGKSIRPDDIYVFDELSSKELIILFNYKYAYSQSYTYNEIGTMRYVRK